MNPNNPRMHRRRLVRLAVACLLGAMLAPGTAVLSGAQTPNEVPEVLLDRLRTQYVPEDDETQGLTESMKLRRYQSILREGAFAERRYAEAANLHELLHLLFIAAKGKATLEGTPESGQELMAIAARLAASSAPADQRLSADSLIVRARLDELGHGAAGVAGELDAFVARFAGTPGAAEALIAEVSLARMGGAAASIPGYLNTLERDHVAEQFIGAFLESQGRPVFMSRLFTTRLRTLDGGELVLPRDTLGRPTLLHFWSVDRPGLEAPITETEWDWNKNPTVVEVGVVRLADAIEEFPSLNIVGINLDTDRAAVQRFVDEQELPWTVAFSGLGSKDPVATNYGLAALPAYWLIGPDGRSIRNSQSAGKEGIVGVHSYKSILDTFYTAAQGDLYRLRGQEARVPYYRSGAFLLDMPVLLPPGQSSTGAIPAAELEELYGLVFLPPTLGLSEQQKTERLRQGLERGRQIEAAHGDSDGVWRVRTWMMAAARWLATQAGDTGAVQESGRLARSLLEQETPAVARLLAEYVRLSEALQAEGVMPEAAGLRIESFLASWASTDQRWASEILGVILATEASDEKTRMAIMRGFADQRWKEHPKLRGFLRDYCRANIDAAQYEMRVAAQLERKEQGIRMAPGTGRRLQEEMRKKIAAWEKDQEKKRDEAEDAKQEQIAAMKAKGMSEEAIDKQLAAAKGKGAKENPDAAAKGKKEGQNENAELAKRKREIMEQGAREAKRLANPLASYGGGEVLPNEPMPVAGELPRLDGGVFRLPEDAGGKPVIIQFWSVAAPPEVQPLSTGDRRGGTIDIGSMVVLVAVNMDDSRAEAEEFLEAHPEFNDWIHVFSGEGWHDPLARELDVYSLPRAVLVDPEGLIKCWAARGQFPSHALQDQYRRAQYDARTQRETSSATSGGNKQ